MASFLLRRLLQLLLIALGRRHAPVLPVLHRSRPTPPSSSPAAANRAPDPQVVENIEKKYGLDKPMLRPVRQLPRRHRSTVDFGSRTRTKEPVIDIVKRAAARTASASPSGRSSSRRRSASAPACCRPEDATPSATTSPPSRPWSLSAIPVFVLAYLIKQITGVYAFQHDWPAWAQFPTHGHRPRRVVLGRHPDRRAVRSTWSSRRSCWRRSSTAIVARLTRTRCSRPCALDHVRTARAKGLAEKQVMRRHVLRNAMIPVVTFIGIDFGTLVGAAILTETVFNWPGLGSQDRPSAADGRDLPVVLGPVARGHRSSTASPTSLVDLSYAYFDPRVRLGDD